MKRLIRYTLLSVMVSTAVVFTSCEKQLDQKAADVASEQLQWQSISDTKAGLMGIYGLMRAALYEENGHWIYGDLRAGDFHSYTRADLDAIHEHDLKASYPLMKTLTNWRRFYAVINAASLFIERAPEVLEKDKRYTEINLKWDVAQARAIRAFMYFYMTRIWGDLPLLRSSFDNGEFLERPKNSVATILDYAESELLKAAEDLPYVYSLGTQEYYNEGFGVWYGALFNKITAYSLLSHVAVWGQRYIQADAYSKFVLDNYARIGVSYSSIDVLTGSNGIFSQQYAYGRILGIVAPFSLSEATVTGHIEDLTLAEPLVYKKHPALYVPKDTIISLFPEPNDTRFGIDTISGLTRTNYFTNYSGEVPIFSKIKVLRDGGVSNPSYAVYGSTLLFTRLEEMTLLRAEILAVLKQDAEATRLLNVVKTGRKMKGYTDASSEDLLTAIFQERRRELMGEGWRWYDLVRYNRLRGADPKIKEMIEKEGIYWPIAQEVLNNNKKLEQNAFWK
ncbi:RagB/SusD family nutrient uptake outer membrane protein [Sphingobacterium psychroaquaticum]|uniref:RagB/SusD family nutrient uptake outer membrane protein n=1 Tax=Sphingobacterium psychroaquaticum TaxID=561061 RepID=UPI00106B639A|nr:RagB/SusD family nutrient uptake outer membrane protein [Sphingobacterium psychroaquaticum]QBQ40420.1 RagB/SusD family nutrient uptake outer membrane protein [Sphingobacterium psychroaquaticum]